MGCRWKFDDIKQVEHMPSRLRMIQAKILPQTLLDLKIYGSFADCF